MKFSVRAFAGMRPGTSADLLKPGEAALAQDCVLQGGDLEPLRAPLQVVALTPTAAVIRSIYRYGQGTASDTQFWFQSANDVNWVRGAIDGDTEERTYFTGHLTYPSKVRSGASATGSTPYPAAPLPMGLYKPASAPTATVTGTATDSGSVAEDVVFVVTLVTEWGEEGPPSDPSPVYTWRAGQSFNLNLPTTGAPSYPGNTAKSGNVYVGKRLYRSATGSSGSARWLLVNTGGDIPFATSTYTDATPTSALGEALKTRGWLEPPDDMRGLTAMDNGMMAGFSGNTVCFCEPYYPYAWPVRYQRSVNAPVTAIAAFGQSLLVSTTRGLHLISGPDPGSLSSDIIPEPQVCTARRAAVPMRGGVIFPTPDGLGYVTAGGFQMLSDGLMTAREWATYTTNPSSLHAYEMDGRYVLFYDNGTTRGGLVFNFGSEPSLTQTSVYATAGFRDPGQDALFLCIENGATGRDIRKWDAGAAMTATWTSGMIVLPSPTNLGAARVSSDGVYQLEILANGTPVAAPITSSNQLPFKLPAGYRERRLQFRISATQTVRSVELADTMKALVSE